jgi:orotate phosphoribosyltransferase
MERWEQLLRELVCFVPRCEGPEDSWLRGRLYRERGGRAWIRECELSGRALEWEAERRPPVPGEPKSNREKRKEMMLELKDSVGVYEGSAQRMEGRLRHKQGKKDWHWGWKLSGPIIVRWKAEHRPSPAQPNAEERRRITEMLAVAGSVKFGEFVLASGRTSSVYIDVKRAWTEPARLDMMAAALARRVGDADRLAGMELGAVPLVVATALRTGLPYLIIRKAANDHGTRQRFEGKISPGAKVLLIEDVSSTGSSALESVRVIRGAGGAVARALVVVDRGMGAIARLETEGVALEPLVALADIPGAGA